MDLAGAGGEAGALACGGAANRPAVPAGGEDGGTGASGCGGANVGPAPPN